MVLVVYNYLSIGKKSPPVLGRFIDSLHDGIGVEIFHVNVYKAEEIWLIALANLFQDAIAKTSHLFDTRITLTWIWRSGSLLRNGRLPSFFVNGKDMRIP